jgi:hypothetical protein
MGHNLALCGISEGHNGIGVAQGFAHIAASYSNKAKAAVVSGACEARLPALCGSLSVSSFR